MSMKNVVLGIGIVVVFALVLWQGIETFYPSPQWQDYCEEVRVPQKTDPSGQIREPTQAECEADGGTWRNGYCDYYYECQQELEAAQEVHSQRVFFISLVIAVLALIVGFTVLSIEPVGSALIGSGIWAIFWGSAINWRNFSNGIRFGLLLVALVLLIWIAVRLNTHKKEKGFWAKLGFKKK